MNYQVLLKIGKLNPPLAFLYVCYFSLMQKTTSLSLNLSAVTNGSILQV